ncbi:pyridoxamine 5'-phosphate oxidase family protein [Glaciibacter superstes]|uniref:pyridoxamine 5'-phosphate oxidase family protein n=1 Tax=Glaciibacter superstes TaxID=501023 RepID=UPI000412AF24|nr:pyridoxamine 5'-phosphate oxidase family protein [Glaciibacter superstes]
MTPTDAQRAHSLGGDESLQLPEFDSPPADPLALVREWFAGAEEYGVREPRAATLSTADPDGRVSARTVLIIGVDEAGLLFSTDSQSLKGRDLAANPAASVTFYWRETLQQLRVTGVAPRLGAGESDRLFAARTLEARAATAVSHQGEPLASEAELDAMV